MSHLDEIRGQLASAAKLSLVIVVTAALALVAGNLILLLLP